MDQELIAYFDDRFRETTQQFETLHREIGSLRQETTQQIETLRQEFETLRQETTQRFERVDNAIRETQITVEGGRDEVRLLAEGIMGMEEKLQSFRGEVRIQFVEVQQSIGPYYQELDHRVRFLEERVAREGQAPLDIIRERYGRKSS